MIRKVFREVGFRLLSAYAVMEETLQKVLVKLRNEGF